MVERVFAPGISVNTATFCFGGPKLGRYRSNVFNMMLTAELILIATGLMSCANRQLADDQPAVTSENAKRPRTRTAPAVRATAARQSAPAVDQHDASPAAPEQANSPTAGVPLEHETTAAIVQPAPIVREMAAAEPRTIRALNCRDQAFKQYPPVRFGPHGNATAQRDFFDSCMRREGNGP